MGTRFVTESIMATLPLILIGALSLATGLFMVMSPIAVARIMWTINKDGLGREIPLNNPERVAASLLLRTQWRVTGGLMSAVGVCAILRGGGLV
jgi:hypothetical protein